MMVSGVCSPTTMIFVLIFDHPFAVCPAVQVSAFRLSVISILTAPAACQASAGWGDSFRALFGVFRRGFGPGGSERMAGEIERYRCRGRERQCAISAAVRKPEERRKPERFPGTARREQSREVACSAEQVNPPLLQEWDCYFELYSKTIFSQDL